MELEDKFNITPNPTPPFRPYKALAEFSTSTANRVRGRSSALVKEEYYSLMPMKCHNRHDNMVH